MRGRKASYYELHIDFLRQFLGRDGKRSSIPIYEHRKDSDEEFDGLVMSKAYNSHSAKESKDPSSDLRFEALLSKFKLRDRAFLVLFYTWGFTHREIAYVFNITDGRVCQIMDEIHTYLKEKYRSSFLA